MRSIPCGVCCRPCLAVGPLWRVRGGCRHWRFQTSWAMIPLPIGSGPTVDNPTGSAEALDLLDQFGGGLPEIAHWIKQRPAATALSSTFRIIASGPHSLKAAEVALQARGFDATITADSQVGLADDNALMLAERVRRRPAGRPQVWLMGGEVDVRVSGQGRGGRNVQFAARMAQALDGVPAWQFLLLPTPTVRTATLPTRVPSVTGHPGRGRAHSVWIRTHTWTTMIHTASLRLWAMPLLPAQLVRM